VVDIVLLRVFEPKSEMVLVETGKTKPTIADEDDPSETPSHTFVPKPRLPGTKRRPNDNIYSTARTILTTLMGFSRIKGEIMIGEKLKTYLIDYSLINRTGNFRCYKNDQTTHIHIIYISRHVYISPFKVTTTSSLGSTNWSRRRSLRNPIRL
jgi:hypothetical protein